MLLFLMSFRNKKKPISSFFCPLSHKFINIGFLLSLPKSFRVTAEPLNTNRLKSLSSKGITIVFLKSLTIYLPCKPLCRLNSGVREQVRLQICQLQHKITAKCCGKIVEEFPQNAWSGSNCLKAVLQNTKTFTQEDLSR